MFYPTLEKGTDTRYQVNDPYFRFLFLANTSETVERKIQLAKQAFLYFIATKNAMECNKMRALAKIAELCPEVLANISDEEMVAQLKELIEYAGRKNTLISTPELGWVTKYVRNEQMRHEAEKIVYYSLLHSAYADQIRNEYNWTVPKSARVELIREVLQNARFGSKRKIELANEIGAPATEQERAYFRKLLWDRHYEKAKEISSATEEDILAVTANDLNAGYFTDALRTIEFFLPHRQDLRPRS